MENGDKQKLNDVERRVDKLEARVDAIRSDFPNRERCDEHLRAIERAHKGIRELRDDLQAVEKRTVDPHEWRDVKEARIPPKEWDEMKHTVLHLRLSAVKVGLIVGAILTAMTWLASIVVIKSVDHAFERVAAEETTTRGAAR